MLVKSMRTRLSHLWRAVREAVSDRPRPLRLLYRRTCRLLDWFPLIWADEDWDYDYFLRIVRKKLTRMAACIEANQIITDADQVARQIREVVEHIDNFRDSSRAIPSPFTPEEDERWWRSILRKQDDPSVAEPELEERSRQWAQAVEEYERQQWGKIWNLIRDHGREWWD